MHIFLILKLDMLNSEDIDYYTIEYAGSSFLDCFLCKIAIINETVRCSIIYKNNQVYMILYALA